MRLQEGREKRFLACLSPSSTVPPIDIVLDSDIGLGHKKLMFPGVVVMDQRKSSVLAAC
jgi:hypothetical protein